MIWWPSSCKQCDKGIILGLPSAVCCFDAAIYSQLSIKDVAPEPLYSSCQFRINGACGQHTCSQTRPLTAGRTACLKSHIDQLIRWIPSIIRLVFTLIFTWPYLFLFFLNISAVTSLLCLKQACGGMMSFSFNAQAVSRCCWTVVIHFPAAPFHNK